MGKKYDSLNQLVQRNINVHEFQKVEEEKELIAYAKKNEAFSIRFDREKNYHQLPFYTYEKSRFQSEEESLAYLSKIASQAKDMNCSMLCSNGHQYDDIEICNFVIKIEANNFFTLEWSTKKVPLRNMYEYPTSYVRGRLEEDLKSMHFHNLQANPIEEELLEKIIVWATGLKMMNVSIEGTLYPKKVGIQHEEIVCWQID